MSQLRTLWVGRAVVAVIAVAGILAAVAMTVTWPSGPSLASGRITQSGVEYVRAVVIETREEQCQGTEEDRLPDGTVPESVPCLKVIAQPDGSQTRAEVWASSTVSADDLAAGTKIVLEYYPGVDGDPPVWAWSDFQREVPLTVLLMVFVIVTIAVAGLRGLRSLLGLAVAFGVIAMYLLPALLRGQPGVVVALAASAVIMIVVVYLTHGVSLRSSTALVGTLASLLVVAGLGVWAASAAHLNPVVNEDSFRLAQLVGDHGVAVLKGVFQAGVILAGLGVLNDVTITQASAVWELKASRPQIGFRELFASGMRIGQDHIASTVYTIAFAYAGASLPVLLLLVVYELPLLQTLSGGIFAEEIVRTLAGAIGLVMAIPLTTAIAALVTTYGGVQTRGRHGRLEPAHSHVGDGHL